MLGYLSTLPSFVAYFGLGIALTLAFLVIYLFSTPQRELALIRAGNVSASVCLTGALIGFALPLASAISHSVALADLGAWGLVALVVQVATYLVLRLVFRDLRAQIEADRIAVAILIAGASIAVGLLNAAAMTY